MPTGRFHDVSYARALDKDDVERMTVLPVIAPRDSAPNRDDNYHVFVRLLSGVR